MNEILLVLNCCEKFPRVTKLTGFVMAGVVLSAGIACIYKNAEKIADSHMNIKERLSL